MDTGGDEKLPLRTHLERAAETSEAAARDLEGPPLPSAVAHCWDYWRELHAWARPVGGMGGQGPIPPSEYLAWQVLTGIALTPLEVRLLREIELVYLGGEQELWGGDRDAYLQDEPDDD